jgi:hypothetical protein
MELVEIENLPKYTEYPLADQKESLLLEESMQK